ncbi:acyltransferase [Paenibacillus sinopodophylli]|uniref:acyltransferase n=1 Tax=Paenibacillus sinopodophylli TaxID=1837342 RepID=UPI00110D1EED|nr:acyltransferase [Paenibacillus sinopodophylli]
MEQAAKRPYIPELDLVRAFGILAVILIHSTSAVVAGYDHHAALYPLYVFLNTAAKFAVPIFIFLSGFVLFYNYYDKPFTAKTIGQFYKKRMSKILIPFLLFSIFYFAFRRYAQFGFTDMRTFLEYFATTKFLSMLFSGKTYTHLYFVIIIIQFYILSPLLLYAVKRFPLLGKHIVWIGMLVQWLFIYKLADEWSINSPGSYCFTYMLYFTTGAFIGIYYMKLMPWINIASKQAAPGRIAAAIAMWVLFIGSSLLLFYFHYENRLYQTAVINTNFLEIIDEVRCITAGLLLLQLAYWAYAAWNKAVVRALVHIGATSFGIYLVHPIILFLYRKTSNVGDPLLYHGWVAGGFFAALLIPWAIVALSAPFKWHWLLFGPLPTRKKKSTPVQPTLEA